MGEIQGESVSTDTAPVEAQGEAVSGLPAPDDDAVKHKSFETALRANLRKASQLKAEPKKAEPSTPAATDAKPTATDKAPEPVAEEPKTEPQPKPVVLAPNDMNAAEKAAFEKADPALQGYLSRRAYEMRRQLGEHGEKFKQLSEQLGPVSQVVKDHSAHMLKRGKNIAEVVDTAVRWDMHLEQDPVTGLLDYCEAWGVSPDELVQAAQGRGARPAQQQAQQQQQAPDVEKLIAQHMERERQKDAVQKGAAAVQSWTASKPHFADPGTATQLEAAMSPIVAALRQSDPTAEPTALLETALDIVLKREQFAPLRAAIEAREQAERTRTEAAKALQSSRSISGGPGGTAPRVKYGSFEENFRANLRK